MTGTLFGVGVGPGDPDLMTIKADRLIRSAEVVAYPALTGGDSLARAIAARSIPTTAREIVIEVPMTTAREPAQLAYDGGADAIAEELAEGRDVVCLCEGDPFFYGSFMYLFARLADRFQVEVVPGVSSLTACAARASRPLVARNELMTVIPGPLPDDVLARRIDEAETLVIMKVGRHLKRLRKLLDRLGYLNNAVYVERATMPDERRLPLKEAPEKAPYFSMILVTKGADPWL